MTAHIQVPLALFDQDTEADSERSSSSSGSCWNPTTWGTKPAAEASHDDETLWGGDSASVDTDSNEARGQDRVFRRAPRESRRASAIFG